MREREKSNDLPAAAGDANADNSESDCDHLDSVTRARLAAGPPRRETTCQWWTIVELQRTHIQCASLAQFFIEQCMRDSLQNCAAGNAVLCA